MEAIAWELYDKGYSYGDIATYALTHDVAFEDAMLEIWMKQKIEGV